MNTSEHGVRLQPATLKEEIVQFLATFANAETRGTYERCLREFVRWYLSDESVRFRVQDVERYKQHLALTKRLSPVSVSTYLTAVRRFCSHLVSMRILPDNPAEYVEGNKRPTCHTRAQLSEDDVARLLQTLSVEDERCSRNCAIITLMVDCGLTEAELVRLNVEDCKKDGPARILTVRGKGTGSSEDSVAMTFSSAQAVERYLAWRKRNYGEPLDPSSPLFLSTGHHARGGRLTTRAVRDMVNRHLMAAGVKRSNVTPHSLRHTAARRMAVAGARPEEIRRRLRLGSIQTVYVYLR